MDKKEFEFLLKHGEGLKLEFKESFDSKTTRLEKQILGIISRNPNVTRDELAAKLNLSPETVKEYLAKLKQKNLLKRVGSDKGGHWEVVKK